MKQSIAIHDRSDKLKRFLVNYTLYIMMLFVIGVFASISPAFLSANNLLILLANSSPILILSTGLTFVLLIAELDMSVGSILCASALLWGYGTTKWGFGIAGSTALVLAVSACIGLVNALLIVKLKINSFLVTLGMQIVVSGCSHLFTNCIQMTLSNEIRQWTMQKVFNVISPMALLSLLLIVACALVYRYTAYGRQIKAIGTNRKAAQKIGIKANHIVTLSFVISAVFAGIAGIAHIFVNSAALASSTGVGDEFDAITACVLGGTSLFGGIGSFVPGVLVGVLFIQLIENALGIVGMDPYLYPVIRGAIIFLAMISDSLKHSLGSRTKL